ncbi:MAG: gliding motility lipoprotein GldD [Bacteroidota bacterium]
MHILIALLCLSCGEDPIPKPKALLRLEYPKTNYGRLDTKNFRFESNTSAKVKIDGDDALTLDYPQMKGAIFISYKPVVGNLEKLLSDAQKLSYEHVVKADGIEADEFRNGDSQVYGMFYEVRGNAASQAQFYVTDSISHFVTGSLYFYAKPNYDSIYPAAAYLQKDIRRIMETLRWKEQ